MLVRKGGGGWGLRGESDKGELEELVVLGWGEGGKGCGEGVVCRDRSVCEDAEEVVVLFREGVSEIDRMRGADMCVVGSAVSLL